MPSELSDTTEIAIRNSLIDTFVMMDGYMPCKERDVPLERLFADVAFVPYTKTVPDVNGAVEVPDRPGLGADPEMDMMEKFRV